MPSTADAPDGRATCGCNTNDGSRHVRAGEFTLPLPVDPETQRDTEAHYLLYDQTVGSNPFNFFDSRIGVEAYSSNDTGEGVHLAAFAKGGAMAYAAKRFDRLSVYAYRYQQGFFRRGFGAANRLGNSTWLACSRTAATRALLHRADSSKGTTPSRLR